MPNTDSQNIHRKFLKDIQEELPVEDIPVGTTLISRMREYVAGNVDTILERNPTYTENIQHLLHIPADISLGKDKLLENLRKLRDIHGYEGERYVFSLEMPHRFHDIHTHAGRKYYLDQMTDDELQSLLSTLCAGIDTRRWKVKNIRLVIDAGISTSVHLRQMDYVLRYADSDSLRLLIDTGIHTLAHLIQMQYMLRCVSMYNVSQKLQILKSIGIYIPGHLIQIESILGYAEPENLRLVINAGIHTLEDLSRVSAILIRADPKDLQYIINMGIYSAEYLVRVTDLLLNVGLENLRVITQRYPSLSIDTFFRVQNIMHLPIEKLSMYIESDIPDIPMTNDRTIDMYQKYKNPYSLDMPSPYLGGISPVGPINILDIQLPKEHTLSGGQEPGNQIPLSEGEIYYEINDDKGISTEKQLWINRIFAPYMPMTHILRMRNGHTKYVSIDVSSPNTLTDMPNPQHALWHRAIYEYLAEDGDRDSDLGKNISARGTIYDFDTIGQDYLKEDYTQKMQLDIPKNAAAFGELLLFWRDYIREICIHQRDMYIRDGKNTEAQCCTDMLHRADSMTTLSIYGRLRGDIDTAIQVDRLLFGMGDSNIPS